jgi:hypothetical protein
MLQCFPVVPKIIDHEGTALTQPPQIGLKPEAVGRYSVMGEILFWRNKLSGREIHEYGGTDKETGAPEGNRLRITISAAFTEKKTGGAF